MLSSVSSICLFLIVIKLKLDDSFRKFFGVFARIDQTCFVFKRLFLYKADFRKTEFKRLVSRDLSAAYKHFSCVRAFKISIVNGSILLILIEDRLND